ncbi:MAG: hypothetical protein JO154_17210 [Chitinophaga sp.]|uniref:hypothetical protein n=1 Tax=Chitinophaga sp. TaxID=1869181 RepID=UPI0025C4717E|nr:hypothetical protein [Chitinophaga sp.]MBV8254341.1 hypothetical protein [Chitinophaga sp.]
MPSDYEILPLRTTDITVQQFAQLTSLFNRIFNKEFAVQDFQRKYTSGCLDYSFHALLIFKNEVVGAFSVIPNQYTYRGDTILMGMGCDSLIHEEHRKDELMLKKLFDSVQPLLMEDNISFLISIPNQTAYPYWKYIVKWKDIGDLSYFVLPVKAGKLVAKKFASIINPINRIIIWAAAWLIAPFFRPTSVAAQEPGSHVSLSRNQHFLRKRFPQDSYLHINSNGMTAFVRFYDEDGVNVAYIMDCIPFSKKNLDYAALYLARHYSGKADLIMYIGRLDFSPTFLYKIPKQKEPRRQPFLGKMVGKQDTPEYFVYDNWDISLTDFDNR